MSSLKNRTILLTRSAESNRKDSKFLEARGAHTLSVPSIRFTDPDSWAACDDAIHRIRKYDAFLFTSRNAVVYFLKRIEVTSPSAKEVLAHRRVHAVGEKTNQALAEAGIRALTNPDASTAEGIAESIGIDAAGKCFLFPKSDIARDILSSALRELNAMVDEVVVYKTAPPDGRDLDKIRSALRDGEIDAILFFSPSAVRNFTQMIGTAHLADLPIGVIGPTTADAVRQAGLSVSVVSETPATEALCDSLDRFFTRQLQPPHEE